MLNEFNFLLFYIFLVQNSIMWAVPIILYLLYQIYVPEVNSKSDTINMSMSNLTVTIIFFVCITFIIIVYSILYVVKTIFCDEYEAKYDAKYDITFPSFELGSPNISQIHNKSNGTNGTNGTNGIKKKKCKKECGTKNSPTNDEKSEKTIGISQVSINPVVDIDDSIHSIVLHRTYSKNSSGANINDMSDNEMLDAVMQHICSLDECKHMKYTKKYFVDHKEEIKIAKDICAKVENIKYTGDNSDVESISVKIYSQVLRLHELKEFIERLNKNYLIEKKNKLGNQKYFFDETQPVIQRDMSGDIRIESLPKNLSFTMTPFNTFKSIDNIFGPKIKELKERINLFTNNQEWYQERGIPYTLGIMLYGEPGCGKTSMIKAIAKDTNRHVVNIKLRETTTQQQLLNLFFNESIIVEDRTKDQSSVIIPLDQRLYVIEDIDCLTNILHDRNYALKMLKKEEREIQSEIDNLNRNITEEEGNFKVYCSFTSEYNGIDIDRELARTKKEYLNGLVVTGEYNTSPVSISQGLPDIGSTIINSANYNSGVDFVISGELQEKYRNLADLNNKLKRVRDDIRVKMTDINNGNNGNNFIISGNYEIGGNAYGSMQSSAGGGYIVPGSAASMLDAKSAANLARLNAENDKKKNLINLSFMLNLLDGVLETPGRILIVTSNYPEKLDDAILRPGRIDIKIQFKRASLSVIAEMFAHFYNMKCEDFIGILNKKFDDKFTPAEIMDACSNHYTNYKNAIMELESKLKQV
jgi:ATP-dependent 26S proteasome regulatory subunit